MEVETIKILVIQNDIPIQLIVQKNEKIKQYLSEYFKLNDKEFIIQINDKICDVNESFDSYIEDDKPLEILMFDIKKLIEDQKELQYIKKSSVTNTQLITSEYIASQIYNNNYQFNINESNLNGIKYKQVFSSIISNKDQYQSLIIEQKVICIYCKQDIDQNIISTPCLHFFHFECFDLYIYNNLQLSHATLSCLCNCKLPLKMIKIVGEEKYIKYQNLLLENQLFKIQTKYHNQIGKCIDNSDCKFWFFLQSNSQIHKKITCFQCLTNNQIDNTQQKQISIISQKKEQTEQNNNHYQNKKTTQNQGNNQIEKKQNIETNKFETINGFSQINLETYQIQKNNTEILVNNKSQILQEQIQSQIQIKKDSEQGQ